MKSNFDVSNKLQPIRCDTREIYGGYVHRKDEHGQDFILCRYGRIVAVNPEGEDGCLAGVLVNGTPARKRRLWKLDLPVLWENETEIAVKIEFRSFGKIKTILKPLMQ